MKRRLRKRGRGGNGVVELSPFEFLDRLADLVPPPRKHRHRYHGVFALNHKLRPAVTALAIGIIGFSARGCDRWACGRRSRDFVQIHDDRETVQVSPDELPVIDIYSL